MDYLESAFGEFSAGDVDAAVRFALDAILAAERFDRLGELITEFADLGELGGEPGWVLERRDVGEAGNMPGYARWPAWVRFGAFVAPTGIHLGHPEFYVHKPGFERDLSAAMRVYAELDPEKGYGIPA